MQFRCCNYLAFRFRSFQKLRTDGAIDLEFFVIGQGITREYFLAVANHVKIVPGMGKTHEVDSIIYKWNWNLFVPFQCIKTNGAKKWTAVTGEFNLIHIFLISNSNFRVRPGVAKVFSKSS